MTEAQLRQLMHELMVLDWGRELKIDVDIERAITNGFLSEPKAGAVNWPKPDHVAIEKVLNEPPAFHVTQPLALDPELVIDSLFPGGGLICCGTHAGVATTKDRELWRGILKHQSFIVPGPMSKPQGHNQAGELSQRCRENAPNPRRYLVAECDDITLSKNQKASLLTALANHPFSEQGIPPLPLVMAVDSGGKSIHGWFRCDGFAEDQLLAWTRLAVALGHDKAMWRPEQVFRMPGGTRHSQDANRRTIAVPQHILFFSL